MKPTAEPIAPNILITRVFDAPRERVFKAWSNPESLTRWCAPNGCTLEYHTFDFRVGGSFLHTLKTPTGYECRCKGTYLEILAPARIVYTIHFADRDGNFVEPSVIGADKEWPRETTVTLDFEDLAGKTRLTLKQNVSEVVAKRTGAHPSWLQMLDRLAEEVR